MSKVKIVPIERIRRITGYLVLKTRWNNAKLSELKDRVKHTEKENRG